MTRDHDKGLLAIRQAPPSSNSAKFSKSIFSDKCEGQTTETFIARSR